jgi:hypothetical protein
MEKLPRIFTGEIIFPSKILTSYKYVFFNPEILLRQQILLVLLINPITPTNTFTSIDKSYSYINPILNHIASTNTLTYIDKSFDWRSNGFLLNILSSCP